MQREPLLGRIGRGFVRAVDAQIRRHESIQVFSEDPTCILRLSLTRSTLDMAFSDGTRVARGDPVGVIHLWNERMPPMPPEGPDLRWARTMYRGSFASLRLLARYLAEQPELAAVRAIGSDTAGFFTSGDLDSGLGFLLRLGFELWRPGVPASLWGRLVSFWQNVYSWALIWTYNPASMQGKTPWTLERCSLWMSRATLDGRYGPREESAAKKPAADARPEGP